MGLSHYLSQSVNKNITILGWNGLQLNIIHWTLVIGYTDIPKVYRATRYRLDQ